MLGQPAAFLLISIAVIVTPGQDTVLTIRNTLAGGRRAGTFTALGVAAGQAMWTVAASVGVAALLLASRPAFTAVRLAGAVYLVFLGVQSLRDAWRGTPPFHLRPEVTPARGLSPARAFRQGLLSNLANPKMAVFFTSLLPQFVPREDGPLGASLALGLTFCTMTLAWLSGYAVAVARAGDVLRRPAIRRARDAAAGTVLVAFGLRVAAEHG